MDVENINDWIEKNKSFVYESMKKAPNGVEPKDSIKEKPFLWHPAHFHWFFEKFGGNK